MQDSELFMEWRAALRSGDYEQGVGVLKSVSDDGKATYCCLGVLAEMRGDLDQITDNWGNPTGSWQVQALSANEEGFTCTYHERLQREYGLTMQECDVFMGMNDTLSWSFEKIADVMEDAFEHHNGDIEKAKEEHAYAG